MAPARCTTKYACSLALPGSPQDLAPYLFLLSINGINRRLVTLQACRRLLRTISSTSARTVLDRLATQCRHVWSAYKLGGGAGPLVFAFCQPPRPAIDRPRRASGLCRRRRCGPPASCPLTLVQSRIPKSVVPPSSRIPFKERASLCLSLVGLHNGLRPLASTPLETSRTPAFFY